MDDATIPETADEARSHPQAPPPPPPGEAENRPKLVFRTGPLRGTVLALEKSEITIGRNERNDIAIDSDIISSFHARITRDANSHYWLEDRGSKNGTFKDGRRVERARLSDGDLFCICSQGPEVQYTEGAPTLPTLLESTSSVLTRTGSVESVFRELFPRRGKDSITGVRQILDYKLSAHAAKERRFFVTCMGLFLLGSALVLGTTAFILAPGASDRGEAAASRGDLLPAASRAEPAPAAPVVSLLPSLDPIYGSLYFTYHDQNNRLGTVTVRNQGRQSLDGSRLVFGFDGEQRGLLAEPFEAPVPALPPGGEVVVPVAPKLGEMALSDSNRRVRAHVALFHAGAEIAREERAILIYKRDVFNWQDSRRLAIFVDPDDRAVNMFLKKVWPSRAAWNAHEFPPPNVVKALTLITALTELELSYIEDAQNPIAAAMDRHANDRVNFPVGTFLAGFGDCDDLSVLCCAVLEAIGIPTAFAVGNGHVLFLFDTGVTEGDLPHTPLDSQTVVTKSGRVWLPMESTDLARPGASFAAAWAASWRHRDKILGGEMELIEVNDAWKDYIPMNQPISSGTHQELRDLFARWDTAGLAGRIRGELAALRDLFTKNLEARVLEIESNTDGELAKQYAVGLLYARSGLYRQARQSFSEALFGDREVADAAAARGALLARAERRDEEPTVGGADAETDAVLLANLATCMALEAHSRATLTAAAEFMGLAVESFPSEASSERGEMILRLALMHRLKGDLSEEKRWLGEATRIDASFQSVYDTLIATDGTVSGPEEKILDYLRAAMKKRT